MSRRLLTFSHKVWRWRAPPLIQSRNSGEFGTCSRFHSSSSGLRYFASSTRGTAECKPVRKTRNGSSPNGEKTLAPVKPGAKKQSKKTEGESNPSAVARNKKKKDATLEDEATAPEQKKAVAPKKRAGKTSEDQKLEEKPSGMKKKRATGSVSQGGKPEMKASTRRSRKTQVTAYPSVLKAVEGSSPSLISTVNVTENVLQDETVRKTEQATNKEAAMLKSVEVAKQQGGPPSFMYVTGDTTVETNKEAGEEKEKEQGDFEDLDEELKEFLELRKLQQEPEAIAENEDDYDVVWDYEWDYRDLRQLPHSVKLLEKKLQELTSTAPSDDRRIAVVKLKLALETCKVEDNDPPSAQKAVDLANEALKVLGGNDDSLEQGVCIAVLGAGYRRLQQTERSLSFLKRAARFFEEKTEKGQEVVRESQFALSELGQVYLSLGRAKEGVETVIESLDLLETVLQHDDPALGDEFRKAASSLCAVGEWEEAKKLCEKAIRVHGKSNGHDDVSVGEDRKIMAKIFRGMDKFEDALEQFRIVRRIFTEDPENLYWANMGIADCQVALKSFSEAIATLEGCMSTVPAKPATYKGAAFLKLAKAFFLKDSYEEARKRLMSALDLYKENLLAGSMEEMASQLHEVAALFDAMGDVKGSIRTLKIAIAAYTCVPGGESMVLNAKIDLGSHLITHGKAESALSCYKEALELAEKMNKVSAKLLTLTAIAHMELSDPEAAVELLERAKLLVEHRKRKQETLAMVEPGYVALSVYHNLVRGYQALERYEEAVKHQKLLVTELRVVGGEAENKIPDAMRLLQELTEKAEKPLAAAHTR